MSTITQRIPNFLLGISQQPDNRKFPGQLTDSVNAFPDYTLGLLKRPGGQFNTELQGATPEGKWFSILRDQQEKYVAQYDDNVFRIWTLTSGVLGPAGSPRAVDMGTNTGVPATCNLNDTLSITNAGTGLTDGTFEDLATATTGSGTGLTVDLEIASGVVTTVTINQYGSGYADGDTITMDDTVTYPSVEFSYEFQLKSKLSIYLDAVETVQTELTDLNEAQAAYALALQARKSTQEALFAVNYDYHSGEYHQYLTSGILKNSDGEYIVKNDDAVISVGTTLPANYSLGSERTDEQPKLASTGYRVFQAIYTNEPTDPDTLTIVNAGTGLTDGTYEAEATSTTGLGQGLTVDLVVDGGVVTSATINNLGTEWKEPLPAKYYADGDTITITDASFSGVELEYQSPVQEAKAAVDTAQTAYDTAVTDRDNALTAYEAEVADCAITTVPTNAYLAGAEPEDIEVLTLNDYTFVLNKAKTVQLKTDLTDSKPNEAFAVIKVVGTGHYKIRLDGTERATYNAGTGGDVDAIIGDLRNDINGQTFDGTTYTATVVGPGLYISADNPFTIEVVGAPSENAFVAFQDTVADVTELPVQAKDGYVVKVVNTVDIDVDDMWVKFVADGGATYGPGAWEETTAPGIKYKFDELTMPHQLVRQADGSFTFGPVDWEDRLVGTEDPNIDPSFIGQKVNNIFFYRNRLGFLSNEAVVMSRAGDYFNFWVTTALTVTDDDPIDITASSVRPVNHRYVRPVSVGLVLFSDNEQFLLTTDADILSPRTAKINELSGYECDPVVQAVSLGTSLGFISKTPLYSRFYEVTRISNDSTPSMFEQTKIVPELIPQTIDNLIASPALSLVSMGTTGDSTVYQYRFLDMGNDRRTSSWYKWQLTGSLLDQFFDANLYYTVTSNNNFVYVQAFDLTQASEQGYLTLPTGEKTDVCLDLWNVNPYRTYNATDDTTRIFLPYDEISASTFSVVVLGGYIGASVDTSSASVGATLYPTVQGTAGAYYVDIDGDYRGRDLIIGYVYNMEIQLPKFFVTTSDQASSVSDYTGDLIIHRIKVATGLSGPVKYEINITGIPEWSKTIEAVSPYNYNLNDVNLSPNAIHNIPLYQRNSNLTLKIVGDTPFPVSLLSMNWEGNYNTGFYRRS